MNDIASGPINQRFPQLITHAEQNALPGEEDVTLRTACAKVYTLGDGHYQAVVFA